jgi:hypothetical protein
MVALCVLHTETVVTPRSIAYFTAMRVSIVSPDWLTEMTIVRSESTGSR